MLSLKNTFRNLLTINHSPLMYKGIRHAESFCHFVFLNLTLSTVNDNAVQRLMESVEQLSVMFNTVFLFITQMFHSNPTSGFYLTLAKSLYYALTINHRSHATLTLTIPGHISPQSFLTSMLWWSSVTVLHNHFWYSYTKWTFGYFMLWYVSASATPGQKCSFQ